MKVTYFYRPRSTFAFSIEGVFSIIKDAMKGRISYIDYYCTNKWKRLYSLTDAWKYQSDINHITGDAHFLALGLKGSKTILTVHDMAHFERKLTGLRKQLFRLFWFQLPISHVQAVTTISEFTKQKLLEYTSVSPDKIRVIYNPAPDFKANVKPFRAVKQKILQVGSGSNKNIYRLIEAVTGLDYHLILVRRKDIKLETLLREKNISYEWYQNLSKEEIYNCYVDCDIVYFASEYEGFGVPILEGNAVGRCVITSNVTSMPEVAGDSALIVDPFNVLEIRNAILKITEDAVLREDLIKKGFENLKRFSPEVIAAEYYDLYTEIHNKGDKQVPVSGIMTASSAN